MKSFGCTLRKLEVLKGTNDIDCFRCVPFSGWVMTIQFTDAKIEMQSKSGNV